MTTVTHGEIIDLMLELKTRPMKEKFFACFCSSSTSGIHTFNHIILGFLITISKRVERLQTIIRTAKS